MEWKIDWNSECYSYTVACNWHCSMYVELPSISRVIRGVGASWEEGGRVKKGACIDVKNWRG